MWLECSKSREVDRLANVEAEYTSCASSIRGTETERVFFLVVNGIFRIDVDRLVSDATWVERVLNPVYQA